jgi:tetratricopeptide (TPR) repeat protein
MRLYGFLLIFLILSSNTLHATESPLYEGFSLLEKGHHKAAFTGFSSVKLKSSSVYAGMGMAKYMGKDFSSSVTYLTKALKSPAERQKWTTNYFAGLACFELGDYKNALYYFNASSKIKALPEITLYLGRTKLYMGNTIEAETLFVRVIEKNPKLLEAYDELLKLYASGKQFEAAFKLIDQAKKHLGDDPELIYQRAKLHFILGKFDIAEKELNIAIKMASTKKMQNLYSSIIRSKLAPLPAKVFL